MPISSININDHSGEFADAVKTAIENSLTKMGMQAERYAKQKCPVGTPESTGIAGYMGGTLRNSITNRVVEADQAVYIGSNVKYAPYVECGWGSLADAGFGGNPLLKGHKAQPFLRPAVTDHDAEYKSLMQTEFDKIK